MRKVATFVIFFLLLCGLSYFLLPVGKIVRDNIWTDLDKDILYLTESTIIKGWIWTETEDAIMGQKEKGDLFTVKGSDIANIEKNKLFEQLKNLL